MGYLYRYVRRDWWFTCTGVLGGTDGLPVQVC